MSAVDRTPYHTKYVIERLSEERRTDVSRHSEVLDSKVVEKQEKTAENGLGRVILMEREKSKDAHRSLSRYQYHY